jgi:hypothetical protein
MLALGLRLRVKFGDRAEGGAAKGIRGGPAGRGGVQTRAWCLTRRARASSCGDRRLRSKAGEYQIGNEPSAGRAVGHAVMDVLTLGIWEIAGTPIEGFQGEKYRATVIYGDDDKVTGIKTKASSNM